MARECAELFYQHMFPIDVGPHIIYLLAYLTRKHLKIGVVPLQHLRRLYVNICYNQIPAGTVGDGWMF